MRILYVICIAGIVSAALLWLGKLNLLRRKVAAALAVCCLAVSGVLLTLAVLPGNSFYGDTLTGVKTDKKIIALTFDDGPYPPYTHELLKVLADKNIHATFFMVGDNAFEHQNIVRLVHSQGHEIALHAGKHQDLLKLNRQEIAANIDSGKMTLQWLTGEKVKYMRPPHGFRDWAVMDEIEKAGLRAVNWDIIPRDWTNPGAEEIARRVCEKAHPGAIVLLHDGDSPRKTASRQQTIEATAMIIERLRAEGYEFVTISQLIAAQNK